LNEEINGKYKSKLKTNPENEQIIKKLKDTFKKLVYKELKEKPNISQILLDNNLDEDLKVKILRKYIKFTTEDEVFSDEADKIKIEIKNLLKQKKLRQSDDYEELGKQVESKIMPPNLKIKLEDIYYRVIGGDQPKLHNLLNNLIKLPFERKENILDQISNPNISKEEKVQFIKNLYAKLDNDLYGLEETKDSIISWICQKISNPNKQTGKYLCLCGPAGVGKTSIVHSISDSLGIPYSYISLANVDEPGSLIGHGYTYEGSQCGSVANGLMSNGCINGILLFDELDKTKEKVQNTLLGIFDPLQNTKFRDAYFGEFNLNLSESMMIVCLNNIANVNPILKDRLHIVNISGYTTKDKKNIIYKYILPKLNTQYNLDKIFIEEKVIDEIIYQTKIFEGIRQIQMYITKIYELIILDEYTLKYNFNNVFTMKNINLLKFSEQNNTFLNLYT
jgi:ATP-dependent Lon protease